MGATGSETKTPEDALADALGHCKQHLDEVKQTTATLKEENVRLNNEVTTLHREASEAEQEKARLRLENDQLRDSIQQSRNKDQHFEEEKQRLRGENEGLRHENKALSGRLSAVRRSLEASIDTQTPAGARGVKRGANFPPQEVSGHKRTSETARKFAATSFRHDHTNRTPDSMLSWNDDFQRNKMLQQSRVSVAMFHVRSMCERREVADKSRGESEAKDDAEKQERLRERRAQLGSGS